MSGIIDGYLRKEKCILEGRVKKAVKCMHYGLGREEEAKEDE